MIYFKKKSRSLSSCNSIKLFDLSTLYTTITHSKLKDKLRELVQLYSIKKNGQRRYIVDLELQIKV
jgi:hypothetical protein